MPLLRSVFASLLAPALALAMGASPGAAQQVAAADDAEPAMVQVAARDLERGETLAPEDVTRVARPEGVRKVEQPESVVGWTTRRVIAAGEPLLPPAVAAPELVKGGDEVEVVFRSGAVQLTVRGIAAGSAALGERVLVRVDAKRRLEGVVIGPALVELESSKRGR